MGVGLLKCLWLVGPLLSGYMYNHRFAPIVHVEAHSSKTTFRPRSLAISFSSHLKVYFSKWVSYYDLGPAPNMGVGLLKCLWLVGPLMSGYMCNNHSTPIF